VTDERSDSTMPRVTIVTTTYRTPPELLSASIESVFSQTLTALELIVVADGPLDPEQAAVVERAGDDSRLRVLSGRRVGRAGALNLGVDAARSELIAIQDADDASHPERLERQLDVLDRRPDIALLGAAVRRSSMSEATPDWELTPGARRRYRPERTVAMLDTKLLTGNPLVHSSIVVRRPALAEVGGYSADRRYQFDHDLYLRMRAAGLGLARLEEPLVLKRVHAHQVFEADSPFAGRLLSAWRLQVDHARREPFPRDVALVGLASARLGARMSKASIRRLRARR
jgi:glycosyltransferase involved in cell wall biosynthesis